MGRITLKIARLDSKRANIGELSSLGAHNLLSEVSRHPDRCDPQCLDKKLTTINYLDTQIGVLVVYKLATILRVGNEVETHILSVWIRS